MRILEHAQLYAKADYPVFPVHSIHEGKCTCGRFCRAAGKHPKIKGGFKSATTDQMLINNWFSKNANIGIATGQASGLVIVDVDEKNGGYRSLEKLEKNFGPLSDHTLTAHTGGGGLHLYFQYQETKVRSRVNALGSGIDIRADGGYVVAAPSRHISGNDYSWRDGFYPPAQLPEDLEEELLKNPARNGYSSAEIIPKGQRNQTLFSIASRLRANGLEKTEIEFELNQINSTRCRPVLDNIELASIAASASRYSKGTELAPMRDYWHGLIYSASSGLKGNVRNVLTALRFHMDADGGNCHPSHELLADRAGLNRQAVANNLKIAESEGWIKSFKVANQFSQGWHYGYIATIPPLIKTTN